MKTKTLAPDTTKFTANGRTFTFQSLTVGRYKEFKKMERHFGWGVPYDQDVKDMQRVLAYLNKTEWVNAAVLINNRLERIQYFEQNNHDISILLCTLFLNEKDEDITTWDMALAESKIEAWNQEGIEATSFFYLAAHLVPGYIANLNGASLSILEGLQTQMK